MSSLLLSVMAIKRNIQCSMLCSLFERTLIIRSNNFDKKCLLYSNRNTAAERRRQAIQESKFLGGDMEHTHLVKGLDFALLQKVLLHVTLVLYHALLSLCTVHIMIPCQEHTSNPVKRMHVYHNGNTSF